MEKLENNCSFYADEIDSAGIFEYYAEHADSINNTEIMPVIENATRKGGKITYFEHFIDHEAKYALYYQLSKQFGLCKFTENDVTNKDSQFYLDNINSNLYKWFRLMEKEMKRNWGKWSDPTQAEEMGKWVNFNRPRSTAEFDVTKLETSRHITKEGDTLERHLGLNYLGQVLREESWFHDKQNGLRIAYFPNGVVREIAYYLDGLPWDAISLADTTGKLYFPGTLHNGNGTMYFYDYHWSNGPVNFATYQNGHMDGPYLRQ